MLLAILNGIIILIAFLLIPVTDKVADNHTNKIIGGWYND